MGCGGVFDFGVSPALEGHLLEGRNSVHLGPPQHSLCLEFGLAHSRCSISIYPANDYEPAAVYQACPRGPGYRALVSPHGEGVFHALSGKERKHLILHCSKGLGQSEGWERPGDQTVVLHCVALGSSSSNNERCGSSGRESAGGDGASAGGNPPGNQDGEAVREGRGWSESWSVQQDTGPEGSVLTRPSPE